MERRADLTYAEFVQQYVSPSPPCWLTALPAHSAWSRQPTTVFHCSYAFSRPVVLRGLTDNSVSARCPRHLAPLSPAGPKPSVPIPQRFRALCARDRLLASFGDRVIRLSTANTYSYQKGELPACPSPASPLQLQREAGPDQPFPAVDLPFQEYVEQLLHPQDPTSLGNGEPGWVATS